VRKVTVIELLDILVKYGDNVDFMAIFKFLLKIWPLIEKILAIFPA